MNPTALLQLLHHSDNMGSCISLMLSCLHVLHVQATCCAQANT